MFKPNVQLNMITLVFMSRVIAPKPNVQLKTKHSVNPNKKLKVSKLMFLLLEQNDDSICVIS